jgi:hypothetical protein
VLLDEVVREFALISFTSTEHAGYRIAALRELVQVAMLRWNLQRSAGIVPLHAAAPTLQHQLTAVFREFSELLKRHNVPDEALREFLDLSERMVAHRRTTGPQRQALPAAGSQSPLQGA